jgi:hypothetical protein
MAQNKHKTKRRIISILCASIIALYALAVPIGAVVVSDEHGFKDFNLYAQSTFPLTVGFSYVTRDPSTGVGKSYVYATDIGGFGEESNKTIFGNDTYTQNYTPIDGTTYKLEGALEYNFLDTQFPDDAVIQWTDGSHTSVIKRGWREISMTNKTPVGGNISGLQQGVVLRARDVAYNPKWLTVYDDSSTNYEDWMLPMFATPTVDIDFVDQIATVLTYSWSCTITDGNGNIHSHSGVERFDTRENNSGALQEIIPIDVLLEYTNYDTIIISDYRGFLDVDYYEFDPFDSPDELVGTWLFNEDLTKPDVSFEIGNGDISGQFCAMDSYANYQTYVYKDISYIRFNPTTSSFLRISADRYATIYNLWNSANDSWYLHAVSGPQERNAVINSASSDWSNVRTLKINSISGDYADKFAEWLIVNATKITDENGADVSSEGAWKPINSSGDGFVFKLRYPLYNTAGVVITGTTIYNVNMAKYGFPTMSKYIDTDNTYVPPLPDYNVNYTGWLGTAVGGFLDFELFPGFSLGGLLGILIGFSFVMLFLKFFAGG